MKYLAFITDEISQKSCNEVFGTTSAKVFQAGMTEAIAYLKENSSPEWLIVEVATAQAAPALLDQLAEVVAPEVKVIVTGKIDTFSFYQWLKEMGIYGYLLAPFNAYGCARWSWYYHYPCEYRLSACHKNEGANSHH